MKRFYKIVSTRETAQGYEILLDGKPVRTPSKKPLLAPTDLLADAVMQEWATQKDVIDPHTMPLTQIISTKFDRVSHERAAMTDIALEYLDTDLLCYRAPRPPELKKRQEEAWDPLLAWFEKKFGVSLKTTEGLVAFRQPDTAKATAKTYIDKLDDNVFTVLQIVVSLGGSLVLALAFVEKETGARQTFDCMRVEEQYKATLYNEEKHGPDPAQEKKDRAIVRDLNACEKFCKLLN